MSAARGSWARVVGRSCGVVGRWRPQPTPPTSSRVRPLLPQRGLRLCARLCSRASSAAAPGPPKGDEETPACPSSSGSGSSGGGGTAGACSGGAAAAAAAAGAQAGGGWWACRTTWQRAGVNTSWCLAGCSIGEFATLGAFTAMYSPEVLATPTLWMWALPVINGLATSVALETALLMHRERLGRGLAVRTALGMSFLSMVAMEVAMEGCDMALTGGLALVWWSVPPMLIAGFLAPLPYNYWRLKKYGRSCH